MIPTGFAQIEATLLTILLHALRPGAMFVAAPLFGATSIPVQVRVALAVAVALLVAPDLWTSTKFDILSLAGIAIIASELLIGLALGFALRMGVAAAQIAGEVVSNALGLGFAAMQDPLSGASSPAVAQFMAMLATLLLLVSGGHLVLIDLVARSYATLPIGGAGVGRDALWRLVAFGSTMFALAVQIALPVAATVLAAQFVAAVATRSAPALNLFAVGMPATVLVGVVMLAFAWPQLVASIELANADALTEAASLVRSR
jgi:flagellar biosynthesis protein FliR